MSEFRVMVSPLSKRAYAGRVKQLKNGFVSSGQRHDVTSDVFAAIVEIIGAGNTHVLSIEGVPQFEVSIKDVRAPTHLDLCSSMDDTMKGYPNCDCGAIPPAAAQAPATQKENP